MNQLIKSLIDECCKRALANASRHVMLSLKKNQSVLVVSMMNFLYKPTEKKRLVYILLLYGIIVVFCGLKKEEIDSSRIYIYYN